MNLNTVTEIKQPTSTDQIPDWHEGYAWLAGGTWLFSMPQIDTHTLIDLESLHWPALKVTADGLEIAATCTIAELERFQAPAAWTSAPLLKLCSHALLMSFKVCSVSITASRTRQKRSERPPRMPSGMPIEAAIMTEIPTR
jgi:hypothetical protein